MEPRRLSGVLLSGGMSRRMGRDKGLLCTETAVVSGGSIGSTWVTTRLELLASFCDECYLSLREEQLSTYRAVIGGALPEKHWIVDRFGAAGECRGPLLGLLSAYEKIGETDILLLAVDLLRMERWPLEELTRRYRRDNGGHHFYTFLVAGRLEPLCSIVTAEGLSMLRSWFADSSIAADLMAPDRQRICSPQAWIESSRSLILSLGDESRHYFHNANRPEDLAQSI